MLQWADNLLHGGRHRTEADYLAYIQQTLATQSDIAKWHLVMDCLNIHQSESLVRLVAHEGLTEDLGIKGKCGILKSMHSTLCLIEVTLPTESVFHFTPKHCSWLNQIEIWFSILLKLLRRASFTSTSDLKTHILDFIAYFNRTMAKPFSGPTKVRR